MTLDRISSAPLDAALVARDSIAAAQWEAYLLEAGLLAGSGAAGRTVLPWSAWLAASWEMLRAGSTPAADRCLLTPNQTARLWRQTIADSPESETLLGVGGIAAAARRTRASLYAFGLSPGRQGGPQWQGDSAAFLRWNRRFEQRLEREGWIDAESLLHTLNRCDEFRPIALLLDPEPMTPELALLGERIEAVGISPAIVRSGGHEAGVSARLIADPAAELEQIVAWAGRSLAASDHARLAVVVPDIETRRDELVGRFAEAFGAEHVSAAVGPSLGGIAIVGAALTAIELLTAASGFETLSRFLRSPFFAHGLEDGPDRAALLECALRGDVRAGAPFVDAWRNHGLRAEIARPLPGLASALDEILRRMPRRATPTAWAEHFQAALRLFGWQGFEGRMPDRLHLAFEQIWSGFAELTPVVGLLTAGQAWDELARVARGQSVHEPLALSGVHLLPGLERIGPGYAGAWIAGFSDQAWPPAPEHDSLLPWSLRTGHRMPGADPGHALEQSSETMARLCARVPAIVYSCPARILDQPQVPNPMIAAWQGQTPAGNSPAPPRHAESRIGARAFEQVADPAPPLEGARVPGGPRTLDLEAVCPVVAFCTARLRAEPLERQTRGVDARLRGLLIHRALELLSESGACEPDGIAAAVDSAVAELVPPGTASWQVLLAAERARMLRILARFAEFEAGRAPFETIAVEQRMQIDLNGRHLVCRIDRIDRLRDGEILIIDYKTGRRLPGGWFSEPLSDCQLPLYAQQDGSGVAGVAAVLLTDDGIEIRAAGKLEGILPGRPRLFDGAEWADRLARWREDLGHLIDAFAAGDVGIPIDDPASAAGPWAAVTRVLELRR